MTIPPRDSRAHLHEPQSVQVPAGAPTWITAELIEHTLQIWQPFYEEQLIPEQAMEIIMGMGRMVDLLSSEVDHEAVRRTGESQQS